MGATITTTAIVNAVNDALEFAEEQFGYAYTGEAIINENGNRTPL